MRIKILISLIFVFISLVLNAYAILEPSDIWWEGEGSLADQLINASLGLIPRHHMPTPEEARALDWENSAILKTPILGARTLYESPVNESSAASMPDTTVAGSSVGIQNPTPSSANLAGTWSLDLNDTPSKQVVLTLFQIEDKVFGSGSMKNGTDILVVVALGALQDDQIYLDITPTGTISPYSLVMTSSGDRGDFVSGDYKAYTADGQTWMVGKVQGRRIGQHFGEDANLFIPKINDTTPSAVSPLTNEIPLAVSPLTNDTTPLAASQKYKNVFTPGSDLSKSGKQQVRK
jgi:hypothetical protein